MITADMVYGHTDSIILRRLLDGDSYGYEINRTILERSHGLFELKEATLYTAMRRLEKEGFVRSYWGDDAVSGGGRRRYFTITDTGRAHYARRVREWHDLSELMGLLVEV